VLSWLLRKGKASEHQYIPLGAIGFFSYIGYYFIWHHVDPSAYQNIGLRVVGSALCFILMLKSFWPTNLRTFLPIYWYVVLLYSFPFFFTFMMLMNPQSYIWIMTDLTGVFFLMLLAGWIELFILVVIGFTVAWLLCFSLTHRLEIPPLFVKTLPTYITVLLAGAIFIYRREAAINEKFASIKALGTSIAHELRTPLGVISSGIRGMKKLVQEDVGTNTGADNLEKFLRVADNIESETHYAFVIIDMLLVRAGQSEIKKDDFAVCSIVDCIEGALDRYPFDVAEKKLISRKLNYDFNFNGNEMLILHVLFNLLKNSLYYIKAAGKGEVLIWSEEGAKFNYLHFKDTGQGVLARDLPRIFERFFTRTPHGTGIGLAFCKMVMESFGGDIVCRSKYGEYTEFVMSFPKLAR